ncbi:MAG: helix-hairpin-helix domain-containing protein [Pseudomonadales bacterium]|nr:helix-hairpin-helix domain-containing protein [Pseudomonadales bacterium]
MDIVTKQYFSFSAQWLRSVATVVAMLGLLAVLPTPAQAAPVTVNINTATASELSAELLGIGDAKSIAIVKYRESMGGFKLPKDITLVKGIGDVIFEKNQHRIVVK